MLLFDLSSIDIVHIIWFLTFAVNAEANSLSAKGTWQKYSQIDLQTQALDFQNGSKVWG